jgi:hypothetical protein
MRTKEFISLMAHAPWRVKWIFNLPLMLAFCLTASAQDTYTHVEFGSEFSTIRQTPNGGGAKNFLGFGGRFDCNLNRRLALEAEVDFFPGQAAPLLLNQGGQTLQAVFGVRAKVVQTHRLSVFGLIRPGLFHFSDVLEYSAQSSTQYLNTSATRFELNLGGGIEYYVSPRWVLRADIAGNPYRVPNQSVTTPDGPIFARGKIEDTTRLSLGVAYRPGALIENGEERKVPGNWEFGPLFSTMILAREGPRDGVTTEVGFGVYASYRFYGVFYLDGDLLYFPQDTLSSGAHDGGQILQGLFGIKGGIRRNHFGFFGKVRPGFQSYSRALASATTGQAGSADVYHRDTSFVLDLGGIVEFYPTEKSTLRLEAGDTHIFYGPRNVNAGGAVNTLPSSMKHSIQFIFGYGWRF